MFRKVFSWNVPEVFSLTFRVQSLQHPEGKLLGIPEVEVISRNPGSRCNLLGISESIFLECFSWNVFPGMLRKVFSCMFRKVFSWNVPEVFFCLPRSLWETGSCVLRGRLQCAMVRFFATKYKIANETLTSWQRRKFCSVFYKKQTNLLLGIMLPDVCKADFCNYPLKFSFNGYLFETLWS